ncbi:MAG: hypothetical protein JHD16_11465, partial [Solirubrobacteraceae bacterium]|nr:hypothetical protein [Solirubrobacteraceae bacterium]
MSMVPSRVVAVVGGLALILYLALPPAVAALAYPVFGIVLVAAVLYGVASGHLSTGRGAWLVFALANALWVIGDLWTGALEVRASDGVAPFPSVADGVYLAGFPVLAIATIWAARLRGLRRDPVAALDGFMVAAAAAVPIWVLWVAPALKASDPQGLELVVTLTYPAMDLLLIGCGTRFVLGGGRWNQVTVLMVGGLAINIVTDIAYNGAVLAGTYAMPDPIDLGFLLAYVVWAVGALHPDARTFAEGGHRMDGVSYRARTWALVAIVVCPLSVLAVAYVQGDPVDGGLVAGAFAAICAAMVLRLRLIARTGSSAWHGPALLSVAALVVVVASVGLTSLQQQSIEANTNAQGLTEAVLVAERLDAIAMRAASVEPQLGLAARGLWRTQVAELRLRLAALGPALDSSDQRTLELLLSRYEQALARQLQLADDGFPELAERVSSGEVATAHDTFIREARASVDAYRIRAEQAARTTRLTTVLALTLSVLLLTLLLVRFG